jgi:hypothetical protein
MNDRGTFDECDCTEDNGPCEAHSVVLVSRDGASARTADELTLVQIDDTTDVWRAEMNDDTYDPLTPEHRADVERLRAQLDKDRTPVSGCAWFEDPDDADELREIADYRLDLPPNVTIDLDDGYVIRKITGGPLLDN